MKPLMSKKTADDAVRESGLLPDITNWDLVKTQTAMLYVKPSEDYVVVVTVNAVLASLLESYGTLIDQVMSTVEVDDHSYSFSVPGTGQLLRYGDRSKPPAVVLPLFILRMKPLTPIAPGSTLYGPLRSQCMNASQIWAESDIRDLVGPEFGHIEAERAREFWKAIHGLPRLYTLQPLVETVLEQPDPGMYIPYLRTSGFGRLGTGAGKFLVPYDCVYSLGAHAAIQKKSLYSGGSHAVH